MTWRTQPLSLLAVTPPVRAAARAFAPRQFVVGGAFPGGPDDVAAALLAPRDAAATDDLLPADHALRPAAETALRDALRIGAAGAPALEGSAAQHDAAGDQDATWSRDDLNETDAACR